MSRFGIAGQSKTAREVSGSVLGVRGGTLLGSGQWRKVQLTSASVWATGFLQPRGETPPGAFDQRKSRTAELRAGDVAGVSIRVLWQDAGERTGQRFARDLR